MEDATRAMIAWAAAALFPPGRAYAAKLLFIVFGAPILAFFSLPAVDKALGGVLALAVWLVWATWALIKALALQCVRVLLAYLWIIKFVAAVVAWAVGGIYLLERHPRLHDYILTFTYWVWQTVQDYVVSFTYKGGHALIVYVQNTTTLW